MPGAIFTNPDRVSVYLDGTTSEGRDLTVELTQYPLEDGSSVTDHATVSPVTFKIDGQMSRLSGDSRTLESRLEILEAMAKDRQPLTITSGLRVLRGQVITSLSTNRSASDGEAANVSVATQELRLASAKTTTTNSTANLDPAIKATGSKKIDIGSLGGSASTGVDPSVQSSVGGAGYNYLRR